MLLPRTKCSEAVPDFYWKVINLIHGGKEELCVSVVRTALPWESSHNGQSKGGICDLITGEVFANIKYLLFWLLFQSGNICSILWETGSLCHLIPICLCLLPLCFLAGGTILTNHRNYRWKSVTAQLPACDLPETHGTGAVGLPARCSPALAVIWDLPNVPLQYRMSLKHEESWNCWPVGPCAELSWSFTEFLKLQVLL